MPNPIISVFSDIPQSSETSAGSSAAQNTQRYKEIEQIAKYNRDNNTNFYTLAQIQEHQKKLQELERAKIVASNPDPEDVRDAYISALNPQTTKDVDRINKWDEDAKATNAIGLAVVGALPEMVTYGVLPGLASYLTGTATGIGGGYLGAKAGNYLDKKLGTSVFTPALEFVGGLAGYGVGNSLLTKTAPYQIKKLNRSLSDIFGNNSGITKAGETKINWEWRNPLNKEGAAYGNNTIYSKLYAKPHTIGHEYGHHISYNYPGLRSSDVLGAYTPGYEYAPGIDPELNYVENFADWFKTVTGNKYTGSNQNLLSRQQAIDGGLENTQFFGVVKPNGPVSEFQLQSLPGGHLKSTMPGSPLEKMLSKDGSIHRNQLESYLRRQDVSEIDREILQKVLDTNFKDSAKIDYNLFRSTVQNHLGALNNRVTYQFADYGLPRIGIDKLTKQIPDGAGGLVDVPLNPEATKVESLLFMGDPDYYGVGSTRHFNEAPLGHIRGMVTTDEPSVYHIIESQSDKFQHFKPIPKTQEVHMPYRDGFGNDPEAEIGIIFDNTLGKYRPAKIGERSLRVKDIPQEGWAEIGDNYDLWSLQMPSQPQETALSKFWQERQLIEATKRAAKNGQTSIRYPIRETAAQIEGYPIIHNGIYRDPLLVQQAHILRARMEEKIGKLFEAAEKPKGLHAWEIDNLYDDFAAKAIQNDPDLMRMYNTLTRIEERIEQTAKVGARFSPEHETVLKHYSKFPKIVKNAGLPEPSIVTDPRGYGWYQFDIPKQFIDGTAEYRILKQGGKIKSIF